MANFPSSTDDISNPTGSTQMSASGLRHSTQHSTVNDIVEAIEDILVGVIFINVKNRNYAATGDGVTDDRAAIVNANAAAQALSDSPALLLPRGDYRIASNLTITSDVIFLSGAAFAPDIGVTVTINGNVQVIPEQDINSSTGTVAEAKPRVFSGVGTPEGAIAAAVGSIYMRTNGGANTSIYVKESGTGSAGWVGK